MRSISVHKTWRLDRNYSVGFAVAALLLGCVEADVPSSVNFKSEQAPKSSNEVANSSHNNVDNDTLLKNFTTEGKLTKTVETPRGQREIYDPLLDEVIRPAFKRVYDKQYENTKYRNSDYRQKLGDINLDLIFLAQEIHRTDIMRLGCGSLRTFEANRFYFYDDLAKVVRDGQCQLSDFHRNLGKTKTSCEKMTLKYSIRGATSHTQFKGKFRPNPQFFPIGYNINHEAPYDKKSIESLVKDLSWEDEFGEFFDYECTTWDLLK